ncbi:uncharacterized protein LOC119983456 [Tripterygium wilfordii]|uniref:uncharacterized protein LOC119983456 n=1 Tax=Tripterygium wilfordii TaxID=458696 RepID=UPI0018F849F4|nr:uncharacterized protein LOC119983456 [Tripterygium wilfordii]
MVEEIKKSCHKILNKLTMRCQRSTCKKEGDPITLMAGAVDGEPQTVVKEVRWLRRGGMRRPCIVSGGHSLSDKKRIMKIPSPPSRSITPTVQYSEKKQVSGIPSERFPGKRNYPQEARRSACEESRAILDLGFNFSSRCWYRCDLLKLHCDMTLAGNDEEKSFTVRPLVLVWGLLLWIMRGVLLSSSFVTHILTAAETSRRCAFKKRMLGLKTKARELAELCYVTVCWVCFGPDGEVVTWLENHASVRHIIGMFQGLGENTKRRQSFDFVRILLDRKRKLEGEIKARNFNKQFVGNLCGEELVDLNCKLESRSQAVYDRINLLQNHITVKDEKTIKVYKFSDLLSTQTVQTHHDEAQSAQSGRDGQIEQNLLMDSTSSFNGDLSGSQFLRIPDWLLGYGYSVNEIGTTETSDGDLVPKSLDEISVGWSDEDSDSFLNLEWKPMESHQTCQGGYTFYQQDIIHT